jgi:hypothetical protein
LDTLQHCWTIFEINIITVHVKNGKDVDKFKDGVEIVSFGVRDKKEHNYDKKLSNGA